MVQHNFDHADATRIAFQGQPGAYSHMACAEAFPDLDAVPCRSFEEAFAVTRNDEADFAMIPVDNTVAGRVADVHHVLPKGGLKIIGEHFLRVNHNLLGLPGADLDAVRTVESHVHALGQCRDFIEQHRFEPIIVADTAGSARDIARSQDSSRAAIASRLAAEIYGLDILASDIEDADHNTTRFLIMAKDAVEPEVAAGPCITSFIFRVRNVPAALYKALGGFATNGLNMIKLESYVDAEFNQAQFYAEILGHPDQTKVKLAFEELGFYSSSVQTLGVYPAHKFRDLS